MIPRLGRSAGEGVGYPLQYSWASLVAKLVKKPPAMWETWVQSLGWEDSPGKGKGSPLQYSGLENSMGCIVHGVTKSRKESDTTERLSLHFTSILQFIVTNNFPGGSVVKNLLPMQETWLGGSPGVANSTPLQYSWLGNPMDRGAWRATDHGVTKQSDTTEQLKSSVEC